MAYIKGSVRTDNISNDKKAMEYIQRVVKEQDEVMKLRIVDPKTFNKVITI